ncbi:NUDIX hydrolase [Trypanosoma theileri]|uniref:NUDIX hydrolase n=1 Tax=Trypanosoma theileri TaxID=67003 RepID=A0A1X0P4N9_9TRYP|nr:NUDIX hydrolase [Trypanosoma theileri]ORC91613.1 NUDIX hydrolase [Trypanosoma theileri]
MLRVGFLLRCVGKELAVVTGLTDAALLNKVLSPTIQPTELASIAAETAAMVQRLTLSRTVMLLELYSHHGVRHEQLFFNGLWKVFKADRPLVTCEEDKIVLQAFAASTANAFKLMCKEGFLHDSQLLAIALGRCIECAPFLPFNSVVDVYEGMKLFDRKYFTLAEVALQAEERNENELHNSSESSTTLLSSQPNVVDVLCCELELRLKVNGDEGCNSSPTDITRLVQSLAVVGVTDASSLSALRKVMEPITLPIEVALNILEGIHAIHKRVVDVLDHEVDDDWMRSERSILVQMLTGKLISQKVFSSSSSPDPQIILGFRRLFETYPSLAESVPQLWDAVRTVRLSHKQVVSQREKIHRPSDGLFAQKYNVKVKPITEDASEAERRVPPQFKTWRGPTVKNQRRKGQGTPQKMGFGTRRISKNYIKMKRKKFTPAVC